MSDDASQEVKIAVLEEKVKNLEKTLNTKVTNLESELEKKANRSELQPIRIIVFGFVGTVLVAVMGALLNLVINSNQMQNPSNVTGVGM